MPGPRHTYAKAGYRRPPAASRFSKGQSGNPLGRPKGSVARPPYDAILGQNVTIREDGCERRVTAAEAFLLQMTKKGLEGDGAAARAAMTAIEDARNASAGDRHQTGEIVLRMVSARSLNMALLPLGMARILDRRRPTAHVKIEPWLVEAALARLGGRQLSLAEQAEVLAATRLPHKVAWPKWWSLLA
jgi:hypothetical protein